MNPGVVFLDDKSLLGGAQLSLLDIVKCYSRCSCVVLFSDGPFRERLEQTGVPVEVVDAPRAVTGIRRAATFMQDLQAVPRVLKLAWGVARIARAYDLLYANSPKALVVGALAGKMVRKPVIWHIRDMTADSFSGVHRGLVVTVANHMVARVVANSRTTAAAFVDSGGQTGGVRIVYNGIDPTPFEGVTPATVDALRRGLNLAGVPVVGVFGRLAPWKGQHVLLEALTHLPGVHALLVGEASLPEEYAYANALREQSRTSGVSDRVHFLGFRHDVPQLMKVSDVVVHTSVKPEPFGRVIVEGMMASRPVVASRAGGALEIIEDGVSGILVPPGDVKSLAGALSDLLEHPEKSRTIVEAGRSVASRFSLQTMLEGVAQNIQQVASKRGNATRAFRVVS